MYKCRSCGESFDCFEAGTKREYIGEFWGADAYDYAACCPTCGSTKIADAARCERCGEVFFVVELTDGICDGCIEEVNEDENA